MKSNALRIADVESIDTRVEGIPVPAQRNFRVIDGRSLLLEEGKIRQPAYF